MHAAYVMRAATADLAREEPEHFQDYLSALFATLQTAQVSQMRTPLGGERDRLRARLQISCPFMSSYPDADKRKERQAAISFQSIGRLQ